MKLESLHNHTTLSDGKLTPLQLLQAAEKAGVGTIAFTDHDALPSHQQFEELKAYRGPVKWLTGIELSAVAPADAGGTSSGFVHVLGLFVDPTNPVLLDRCRQIEEGRKKRMVAFLAHFQNLGFEVTEEDILRQSVSGNIGSPHMVAAIYGHSENQVVIEHLLTEFLAAAKTDPTLDDLKADLDKGGPKQIPYTLFMRSNSFRPAPDTMEAAIDIDEGVHLIRQAGGAAFLAHWYWDKHKIPRTYLEKMLREQRLDGLGTYVFNAVNDYDTRPEGSMLAELAEKYGVATVIGSDAHDAKDLEIFAKTPEAQKSVGQTAKLVVRVNPDLRWANLSA